jgi:hypothetical protein
MTIGLAVLTAGGLGVWGISALVVGRPSANGLVYVDQIRVGAGFVDVSSYRGGDDSCQCVQRWYVGPAGETPVYFHGDLGGIDISADQLDGWSQLRLQVVEIDIFCDRDVPGA